MQEYINFSDVDLPQEYIRMGCEEVAKLNKDALSGFPKLDFNQNIFVQVIGLPKVKEEMKSKLIAALKGYLKKNNFLQFSDIELNQSGHAVLTYENEDQASQAAEQINGQNFDAKHLLQAFTQKKIQQINASTEYKEINLKTRKELLQFHSDAYPTISIVQDKSKITLKWLNQLERKLEDNILEKSIPAYDQLKWSPLGQYLVLFNENGFSLFGGSKLELLHKFEDAKVSDLLFSPDEKYIICDDGHRVKNSVIQYFHIWNVREERVIRLIPHSQLGLQLFKFDKDSRSLAMQQKDEVFIYEAPEFYQKQELNVKAAGVQQIEWVPQTNYLAIVCYGNNVKTQIFLHDYKRNVDVKWRNISFEIESIQVFPHTYGRWVAMLIKKRQKNKVFATTLQVGNLSRTDPFEIDEHTISDDVENIFCELNTGKFGLGYREKDKQQKPTQQYTFHFYSVSEDNKKGIKLCQIGEQKGKDTNELLWASNGNYFCLVNKTRNSPDQGKVEFGCILKKNEQWCIDITKSTNHFYMSHASWDPTGIYFVTMSDLWHSVNIWSAIGEQLVKDTITKITDIQWRNKPIHLLSFKEEQELQNNAKVLIKKYETEDDKILNKAKYEKEQKRKEMKDQFVQYLSEKKKIFNETKDQRVKLLGFDEDDQQQYVALKKFVKEEII